MKIYDISNEMFTARVFPGDPVPVKTPVLSIEDGAPCNLTQLTFGSHNGTHMDAPRHFYTDGRTIDNLDLSKCIGTCTLIEHTGPVTGRDIDILAASGTRKLLIRGDITITAEAASAMVQHGFEFIGVEGLTVGPENAPMEVHLTLLHPDTEMVIAENLNLADVPVGEYFLVCQPLKLGGLDGAPCRPVLIKF